MKSIMIAATHSGSGKTTVTCGILRALRKRGYQIQPYKVGPDYIDTSYHSQASGRTSKNLDEFILGENEMKYLYSQNSEQVDISVIEGVMGLFDGYQAESNYGSSASISKILGVPVILVMDCKGMAASAGAIAKGFVCYDKNVRISGFILNNVSSENHYTILKKVIEKDTGIAVLGRLPKKEEISLSSRHLGLIPQGEVDKSEDKIEQMSLLVDQYIDLDSIIKIATTAKSIVTHRSLKKNYNNLTLAVAMDKAFNFYYDDGLELLKDLGIKLVFFSPLADKDIPQCDGIYIGGGYPEIFAEELEKNKGMRQKIKQLSLGGMPIYAECGGLMYLGSSLVVEQEGSKNTYQMVGIFAGESKMTKGLKRFGYCNGTLMKNTLLGKAGAIIKGHEFHHSIFDTKEEHIYEMTKIKSDGSTERWQGGYQQNNTMASYLHTHFCSDYQIAYNFCDKMEEYRDKNL